MQGIILKNGLISYYGNPAGYTEKDAAVVDRIFENEELTSWLQSHSFTPKWTDGVMERLMAGSKDHCIRFGLSRSTVKRALNDLTNVGLVEKEVRYRENGSHTSNRLILKKE